MISSESEFLQLAMNSYDNPKISFIGEFEADLRKFTSINVMLMKYREDPENINHRLIINHLIILENCFGLPNLLKMLEYKIDTENKSILETLLFYMYKIDKSNYGLNFTLLEKLNAEQRRN